MDKVEPRSLTIQIAQKAKGDEAKVQAKEQDLVKKVAEKKAEEEKSKTSMEQTAREELTHNENGAGLKIEVSSLDDSIIDEAPAEQKVAVRPSRIQKESVI